MIDLGKVIKDWGLLSGSVVGAITLIVVLLKRRRRESAGNTKTQETRDQSSGVQAEHVHGGVHIQNVYAAPGKDTPAQVVADGRAPSGGPAAGSGRLCNLPPRNDAFTGRVEQLDELHEAVQAGGLVAITQVIKGLGGVGKTQTAIEYGHRHADEYAIRWLIRAETQQQMKIDLAKLGGLLQPELAEVADLERQVACTLQLLNNAESALLIYDNVERPEDIAGLYPTAAGHVLITSRYTDWQTVARAVSLHTFTEGEAMDYFRRRELTDDEEDLKALAHRLGYLPLALAMAAGYMGKQHISAGQYLGEYEGDQAVLAAAPLPQDYDQDTTLTAVFERSFAAAGEQYPLAIELLESLAFLAPDDIPLFVLAWPEDVDEEDKESISPELAEALSDERQRRELVSTLVDYSLISRTDDTLSIHRLTQDVLRNRLNADDKLRQQRLYAAMELIGAHVPGAISTNVSGWPTMSALTPHIRALGRTMPDVPPADCRKPWAALLDRLGTYCQVRAEYAEAKACHERALEIDEAAYGPDHPKVAIRVSNLGGVLGAMGDHAGAKECYERALRILEGVLGPDDPKIAVLFGNLGDVLRETGDLELSKEYLQRALRAAEAAGGSADADVALRLNNLGVTLTELGELKEAKECHQRAANIFEGLYGPNDPKVATAVNNLAGVLRDMGDLVGAKDCCERALKIHEARYGPDHPAVAADLNNLASVLARMGKFTEARPVVERAVAIFTDKLGPEHPHTQTAMLGLEQVRREMGE